MGSVARAWWPQGAVCNHRAKGAAKKATYIVQFRQISPTQSGRVKNRGFLYHAWNCRYNSCAHFRVPPSQPYCHTRASGGIANITVQLSAGQHSTSGNGTAQQYTARPGIAHHTQPQQHNKKHTTHRNSAQCPVMSV
eukprot:gene9844-biopygen1015